MKVTDLNYDECIHCETEEQANAICKLMHESGLEWKGGESYLSKNYYGIYKSETCYFPKNGQYYKLSYAKDANYKIYKAEQFLTQDTKTMQTKITLSNQSQELNIIPLEGFEIDLENSDLKNGKVLFKEVENKYPNAFFYCEKTHDSYFPGGIFCGGNLGSAASGRADSFNHGACVPPPKWLNLLWKWLVRH